MELNNNIHIQKYIVSPKTTLDVGEIEWMINRVKDKKDKESKRQK